MYDIAQVESIFDSLVQKIKTELNEQYELKRIKGTEYAEVFEKLVGSLLLASFDAPLKEKELLIKDKQLVIAEKDLALKEKQLQIAEKDLLLKEKQIYL